MKHVKMNLLKLLLNYLHNFVLYQEKTKDVCIAFIILTILFIIFFCHYLKWHFLLFNPSAAHTIFPYFKFAHSFDSVKILNISIDFLKFQLYFQPQFLCVPFQNDIFLFIYIPYLIKNCHEIFLPFLIMFTLSSLNIYIIISF